MATSQTVLPSLIQLKNVVVATDFSPIAERALFFAGKIAHHSSATVHVVHVLTPPVDVPLRSESRVRAFDISSYEARMLLRTATDHFKDTPHETWLEIGDVRERVFEVCKHVKADLVVVGTRGNTGVTKFFLGSAAENIFRSAPCPVLTIGWNVLAHDGSSWREILYPTDFLPESEVALPYAMSLARANAAQLTVLHVVRGKPPKNSAAFPVEAYSLDFERLMKGQEHEKLKLRFAVDFSRSVADAVHERALGMTGGLIVLGVRETPIWASRLPDVAHKIVALSPCPVLTIRSKRQVAEDWR